MRTTPFNRANEEQRKKEISEWIIKYDLYKQGVPITRIAKDMNVDRATVYTYFKKLVALNLVSDKLEEIDYKNPDWEKIKELVDHGVPYTVLAKNYHITRRVLEKRLEKLQ